MDNDEQPERPWISPLSSPEDQQAFELQRERELREILKSSDCNDRWHRAHEELQDLRRGYRMTDEEEWEMGR